MNEPTSADSAEERPSRGQHLATISYEGRFWDVYLELDQDLRRPGSHRASLAFSAADRAEGEDVLRTTAVIIEPSYEDVMKKAHGLEEHQLVSFLRSLLP